jgi:hypothetical protein
MDKNYFTLGGFDAGAPAVVVGNNLKSLPPNVFY